MHNTAGIANYAKVVWPVVGLIANPESFVKTSVFIHSSDYSSLSLIATEAWHRICRKLFVKVFCGYAFALALCLIRGLRTQDFNDISLASEIEIFGKTIYNRQTNML